MILRAVRLQILLPVILCVHIRTRRMFPVYPHLYDINKCSKIRVQLPDLIYWYIIYFHLENGSDDYLLAFLYTFLFHVSLAHTCKPHAAVQEIVFQRGMAAS